MSPSPYSRFETQELILRDELAVDRTLLSNERTLLAYLRSGISLIIAGVSIMHFATEGWFWAIGIACLPVGGVAGIVGALRFRAMNRGISWVRRTGKRTPVATEPTTAAPPGTPPAQRPRSHERGYPPPP